MFDKKITEALSAPLNKDAVRTREQSGFELSYIEGWWAIAEANRIFGFDGWHRETVDLREVRNPQEVNGKWRVGFVAKVCITVAAGDGDPVVREGTGYGSGIANDLGDAYESAVKEAETDAMKRALMTFGNPFGLALYDKEQRNVGGGQPPTKGKDQSVVSDQSDSAALDTLQTRAMEIANEIDACKSQEDVDVILIREESFLRDLGEEHPSWYQRLLDKSDDQKMKIEEKAA